MFKRLSIILVILFLTASKSSAQNINPPGLNCVTNQVNGDILLQWSLPVNTCGTFVSYDIYFSSNLNGPYTLLTSISNPLSKSWLHTGANGNTQVWYYYMRSNYNCPAYNQISSDTLDNQDPSAPIINYVSVSGGKAFLNWQISPSAETRSYIIYRYNGGFNPIDTVWGRLSTSYTDAGSMPDIQSEEYTIAAMDSCFNTGPFALTAHHTILLHANADPCSGLIQLNWISYGIWNQGVDKYKIYLSLNGGPFSLNATVSSNSNNTYQLALNNDNDSVCIYVEAYQKNGSFTSKSNQLCFRANLLQPVQYTFLNRATVELDASVSIEWLPDINASINNFQVQKGSVSNNLNGIYSIAAPNPIPGLMTYNDQNVSTDKRAYYYGILTTDSCNNKLLTGLVHTIHLNTFPRPDLKNYLKWNAYEIEYGQVDAYNIYKMDASGLWVFETSIAGTENSFIDDISDEINSIGKFCYRIEAIGNLNLPNGQTIAFSSYSNKDCLDQLPIIRVPTAIVPSGTNHTFKPVLLFTDVNYYLLQIYNRWGQQIFESTDYATGWNGSINGQIAVQDVYTYLIRVQSTAGKEYTQTGTFMLIR